MRLWDPISASSGEVCLGSLLQPAVSPPEEGLAGALLVRGGKDRGVGGAQRGVLWRGGILVVTGKTNVVNLYLTTRHTSSLGLRYWRWIIMNISGDRVALTFCSFMSYVDIFMLISLRSLNVE